MKEVNNFDEYYADLLNCEVTDLNAHSSRKKRKSDAIAELQKKQRFQLQELVRKDYQEATRLREKQNERRAELVRKHREQMRRLEARRWR